MKSKKVGGPGKIVEFDGAYYGGYVKPSNWLKNRHDRRLARNQSGKRRVVVNLRERGPDGQSVPAVFKQEAEARKFIRERIRPDTDEVHADEAASWDPLHQDFGSKFYRVNHDQDGCSTLDACTNAAESLHSRMRRGVAGHYHHVAGPYLLRYAQEASWREDNRRMDNGSQVKAVAGMAMKKKTSPDFVGYWQRRKA